MKRTIVVVKGTKMFTTVDEYWGYGYPGLNEGTEFGLLDVETNEAPDEYPYYQDKLCLYEINMQLLDDKPLPSTCTYKRLEVERLNPDINISLYKNLSDLRSLQREIHRAY